MTHGGFKKGDFVIVNPCAFDFVGENLRITELTRNMLGFDLIRAVRLGPDSPDRPLTFYPHELNYEDGTRPTL